MKNIYLILICLLAFTACENSDIETIKKGMTQEEVLASIGKPGEKHLLGTGTELETGEKIKIEVWYYGDNQSITFSNQEVSTVDLDVKQTTEKLLKMNEEKLEKEGKTK